jgi:hypothetical protein
MGTSMEQAGIPLNDTQLDAVRDLAAGRIDFTDYLFRVDLSPPQTTHHHVHHAWGTL